MQSLALSTAASRATAAAAAAASGCSSGASSAARAASQASAAARSARQSIPAHRCLTAWNEPIGRPNWCRVRAYSAAVSQHQPATAAASAAPASRPGRAPGRCPARRRSAPGRRPHRPAGPRPAAREKSTGGRGSTVSPGCPAGTRNQTAPSPLVRAAGASRHGRAEQQVRRAARAEDRAGLAGHPQCAVGLPGRAQCPGRQRHRDGGLPGRQLGQQCRPGRPAEPRDRWLGGTRLRRAPPRQPMRGLGRAAASSRPASRVGMTGPGTSAAGELLQRGGQVGHGAVRAAHRRRAARSRRHPARSARPSSRPRQLHMSD